MSGFDADWLARREPFDLAARDVGLAQQFGAALGNERRPRRIVDLAAGTGASFRALAPQLPGDQHWLMVDHDPLLIAAQPEALSRWAQQCGWHCRGIDGGIEIDNGTAHWRAQALHLDLARELGALDLAGCDGVTTTAFVDLVSAAWLDKLCGLLARSRMPLLAALTVDGRRVWDPPLAADVHVNDAFGRHQARDKGFGPALGPRAAAYLADRLAREGYDMASARSDWRIGHAHRDMLLAMIDETAAVACEHDRVEAARHAEWAEKRRAQTQCGLSLTIGHLDLLARPADVRLQPDPPLPRT
jgi:hypothetical protein